MVAHGLTIGNVLVRHPVTATTATAMAAASVKSLSGDPITVSGYVHGGPLLLYIIKLFVKRYSLTIV